MLTPRGVFYTGVFLGHRRAAGDVVRSSTEHSREARAKPVAKQEVIGTCALGLGEGVKLCRSHIVPRLCFRGYDEKRRLARVSKDGREPGRVQDLPTEYLLCGRCEGRLNDWYEKPFHKAWYTEGRLPEEYTGELLRIEGLDYPQFKLFLLSVLWRADVAQWGGARLGPHQERIREMLLQRHPGGSSEYQIAGELILAGRNVADGVIMPPALRRVGARHVYTMAFAGCAWHYSIASHPAPGVGEIVLSPNGTIGLEVLPFEDLLSWTPFVLRFEAGGRS